MLIAENLQNILAQCALELFASFALILVVEFVFSAGRRLFKLNSPACNISAKLFTKVLFITHLLICLLKPKKALLLFVAGERGNPFRGFPL